MTDYIWNSAGSKTIARLVESRDIEPGTIASLNPNETCAYEEKGIYVGNYTEISPSLKPKPGILGRMIGRKPPERDHLFVANGPHNVPLKMRANWLTGESGGVTANMTVQIPSSTLGKLFPLVRRTQGGEITPTNLAEAVEVSVGGRFAEYVMGLNKPPTTEGELRSHEEKFAQIADKELSEFGVNVTDAVLRYSRSEQADADADEASKVIVRQTDRADALHEFATGIQDVGTEIGKGALDKAADDPLKDVIEGRLAGEVVRSGGRQRGKDLEETEEEAAADREIRRLRRDNRLKKEKLKIAKELQDSLSEGGGDGSDGDE